MRSSHASVLLGSWLLKMMTYLGYAPQLANCVSCQRVLVEEDARWASAQGGMVCGDCARRLMKEGVRIRVFSSETYKLLRMGVREPFGSLLRLRIPAPVVGEFSAAVEGLMVDHFPILPGASIWEMCHVEFP